VLPVVIGIVEEGLGRVLKSGRLVLPFISQGRRPWCETNLLGKEIKIPHLVEACLKLIQTPHSLNTKLRVGQTDLRISIIKQAVNSAKDRVLREVTWICTAALHTPGEAQH
jgi:hypothetical protein